jgi:hypothetical protein
MFFDGTLRQKYPQFAQFGPRNVSMSSPLYPFIIEGCRAMVFVDGENLAIRYGNTPKGAQPTPGVSGWYLPKARVIRQQSQRM